MRGVGRVNAASVDASLEGEVGGDNASSCGDDPADDGASGENGGGDDLGGGGKEEGTPLGLSEGVTRRRVVRPRRSLICIHEKS